MEWLPYQKTDLVLTLWTWSNILEIHKKKIKPKTKSQGNIFKKCVKLWISRDLIGIRSNLAIKENFGVSHNALITYENLEK